MNDIDVKLRQKIKMLDDIDKMVKNSNPKNNRMNYNTSQNFSLNNSKPIDRYPSQNLSSEIDYPLQKYCNSSTKKIVAGGSSSRLNNFSKPKEDNKSSNYNNNVNYEKSQQKTSDYFNYNSLYGNDIFSTKEFTESYGTGKSIKKIKLNERENTHANSMLTSNRSLVSSKQTPSNNSRLNNKSPIKRHKSPEQMLNINININNQNSDKSNSIGDRLYNYGFYLKDKLEKKRIEDDNKKIRRSTPKISSKSKNIQRDPKKFFERLYPIHKMDPPTNNENYENDMNLNAQSFNLNLNKNVDSKQSIHSTPNFDENFKNHSLAGFLRDEEDSINRFYRKSPSSNKIYNQFEYKPKLDKNSIKIAKNLTPSKIRLLAKKQKIFDPNNISGLSNNGRSKTPSQKSKSRSVSKSPRKSQTPTNRIDELYSRGLENIKKREIQHNNKKINELDEFKNYPFKPKSFTTNSPVITTKKSNKTLKKGDTKSSIDEEIRTNFYDKNMHWKKNVQMRNEKIHQNFENEMQKIYTFKPTIQKGISPNDEKFINKNLGQIENYVNKRRNSLQKQKEEEEYKRKRFVSGENYKGKMTVPKEFNLYPNSRSRSKDESISRGISHSRNNSPLNINKIRKKLKTNEFFDDPNYRNENSHQYTNEQHTQFYNQAGYHNQMSDSNSNKYLYNQQPHTSGQLKDDSIHLFMNAVNNLHQQMVNFKI